MLTRLVISYSDGYIDWHITTEQVANRTGQWYFGVVSIKGVENVSSVINDKGTCKDSGLAKDLLDTNFHTKQYNITFYTGGGYAFETENGADVWEAKGMAVINQTKLVTAFVTNHLTSFATGFLPVPNKIDFQFVFAHATFEDNMTIFVSVHNNRSKTLKSTLK